MNGIVNITNRIEEDAEKTANEILSRAQHEANEIRESFAAIAKTESDSILEKGKKLADERVLRLGGVAQLEARKMRLRAKQQMIDLAFDHALESLRGLSGSAYVDVLSDLAVSAAVSGNEELIFSEKDRTEYGDAVVSAANKKMDDAKDPARNAGFSLSKETRPIDGGLVLKEDSLEVDASFKTIVRLMRDDLAGDVANILFG